MNEDNKIKVSLNEENLETVDGTQDVVSEDLMVELQEKAEGVMASAVGESGSLADSTTLDAVLDEGRNLIAYMTDLQIYQEGGSGGGTFNYEELLNLPSIEGVTLRGNKTLEQLGITEITTAEIDAMFG